MHTGTHVRTIQSRLIWLHPQIRRNWSYSVKQAHASLATRPDIQSHGIRTMLCKVQAHEFFILEDKCSHRPLHCSVARHFRPKGHQIQQSNVTGLNHPDSRAQRPQNKSQLCHSPTHPRMRRVQRWRAATARQQRPRAGTHAPECGLLEAGTAGARSRRYRPRSLRFGHSARPLEPRRVRGKEAQRQGSRRQRA